MDTVLRVRTSLLATAGRLSWLPPTLARLAVGVVFAGTGWGKLHHLDKITSFFADLGIPAPGWHRVPAQNEARGPGAAGAPRAPLGSSLRGRWGPLLGARSARLRRRPDLRCEPARSRTRIRHYRGGGRGSQRRQPVRGPP